MSGPGRRFDPSEVRTAGEPEASLAESADLLAAARELEALALSDGIRPTEGFEDRVMAAIATEPTPRLVVRAGSTVRGGRPGAFLLAVRDSWGIASTGGRPWAVRAQALAFVIVVLLAAGSLTALGAATVGGLLDGQPAPTPLVQPGPTTSPTPSSPLGPNVTPIPTPTETTEPTETAEPTDGPGSGETAKPGETAQPTPTHDGGETARPTRTPRPTETPKPGETAEPSDDHGGDGGGGDGSGSGSDDG